MDAASFPYVLIAVATAVGALLGGAVAHWRRGSAFVVTGAIIGGCLAFLIGIIGVIYSTVAVAVALVAIAVIVVTNALFG